MNNRQFRERLKEWFEFTWGNEGAQITQDMTANTDTVLVFWRNHVTEAVAVAKDAEYLPDALLYTNPPRRLAAPAKRTDDHGGLTILRREELIDWLKTKYDNQYTKLRPEFIKDVPGLLEFDFIETTVAGTTFRFRKDRLPYHYKKQFRKELK